LGGVGCGRTPVRATISAPENSTVQSFAISPDGRTLVMAARVNGKQQLWLRPMDALRAQPMSFTDEAVYPFWSPIAAPSDSSRWAS
jgi:hypothetical protein